MAYRILMDYTISNEKNIFTSLQLEGHNVEIEIAKSVVSDKCFINIKINGEDYVTGKICGTYEPILDVSKTWFDCPLNGDFFFAYTVEDELYYDFDITKLGSKLFLMYDPDIYVGDRL